jgi:heptose I phosphotransferase
MYLLSGWPPLLAASGLLLGLLLGARAWYPPLRRRRGFVVFRPGCRDWLRRLGLSEAEHFLDLPAMHVSGHPGRHVARVLLGAGPGAPTAFLKRELRIGWAVRLKNFLAGFGPVSRSLREARALRALEHEGLPGPQWLAAGEDGRGRAFLLVRAVPGSADLASYLRTQPDRNARRGVARALGRALAGLHEAGFQHRDLYAKHVLVDPCTGAAHFLDWQRARRVYALDRQARARDLAALHATLSEALASPRERLACLGAYLRQAGIPEQRRVLLHAVEARARQLLRRRHIQEKRQAQPTAEPQAWICLDGEGLCVTPALARLASEEDLHGLTLERQPAAIGPLFRRWLALPGGLRGLLVRRRGRQLLAALWSRLSGRPLSSPEQRQAALLLRLERYAVPAPRVLALGQRRGPGGQMESFLLTEPATDAVHLEAWLAHDARAARGRPGARRDVLRQAGALLRRLHQAGCYLDGQPGALSVQAPPGAAPRLVLGNVEGVRVRRRRRRTRARHDLSHLQGVLARAGCGRTDLRRFLAGYRQGEGPGEPPLPPPPQPPPIAALTLPAGNASLWDRLFRGVRLLCERPDWADFVGADWADAIMSVDVTDRFHAKQGRTTGRWLLAAPGGPGEEPRRLVVYLKRHYRLPWWQGLLATLWPSGAWSPARQECRHLEWARRQGLPVPAVAAAGEYIGPWGRLQSFLAVEELTDMLPLHEAVPLAAERLAPALFRRWKRGLAAELARLARLLHDRRCFHKDLYLCHFYIHRDLTAALPPAPAEGGPAESWRGRVWLIDLHRLAHHPWTWRRWQLKDLAQLLYSSEVPGIDLRDQLCFWRHYRRLGPRRSVERWLRRCVRFKWRRYRQHNLRQKRTS